MRGLGYILFIAFFLAFSSQTQARNNTDYSEYYVYPAGPDVPYEVDGISDLVIASDWHGDFDAMIQTLHGESLINEQGEWIACEGTHLAINGDLVAKGPDSDYILQYLYKLHLASAPITIIPGNWDLKMLKKLPKDQISDRSRLGKWILSWVPFRKFNLVHGTAPAEFKNEAILASHAGFDRWISYFDPPDINQTYLNWIRYYLGLTKNAPADNSSWVMGSKHYLSDDGVRDGPLFTKALDPKNYKDHPPFSERDMAFYLNHLGTDLLAVGHMRVSDEISYGFGGRVVYVEIGNSIGVKHPGQIGALRIRGGQVESHSYARLPDKSPLRESVLSAMKIAKRPLCKVLMQYLDR
jgi:hypothetical protein